MSVSLDDLRPGAVVRFRDSRDGSEHQAVIKGMYLSPQGPILMVRAAPGAIVSCNVPLSNVLSMVRAGENGKEGVPGQGA